MIGVDQIEALLRGVQKAVVFDIGGHIGIAAFLQRSRELVSARAAHDSNAANRPASVHITKPLGLQQILAAGKKTGKGHLFRQGSHAPAAVRIQSLLRFGAQKTDQNVVDAVLGNIQIGMHADGRDPLFGKEQCFFPRAVGAKLLQSMENQRVMGNDEVSAHCFRFPDHRQGDIEGKQGFLYLPLSPADEKAGVIKTHLQLQGSVFAQFVKNLLYCRHI